ncbi:MAG: sulfatase-like hydrolase/transferase [Clostridia bacterium]
MNKKDILIILSDQHGYNFCGFSNDIVKTPNLDKIAMNGVNFHNSYTSFPLCVPARMSMLTGKLSTKINVLSNQTSLLYDIPTFLHSLAINGYETVLCGRMHFMGPDQRHGFTKRIFDDFITSTVGKGAFWDNSFGDFQGSFDENNKKKIAGKGVSPVTEYDRKVFDKAVEYLSEKHDKPQCIVVGTYGPHAPYVAPDEFYNYYEDKVNMPNENFTRIKELDHREIIKSKEKIKKIRTAYYGLISSMDEKIGTVHSTWKNYLEKNHKEGVFVYLSDHGDSAGERNLYGKKSFYDNSNKIPMIFEGDGIPKGKNIDFNTSIMDIGPTLCELTNSNILPIIDGKSFAKAFYQDEFKFDNISISEILDKNSNGAIYGLMFKENDFKYIKYLTNGSEYLFNTKNDPLEEINIIGENQNFVDKCTKIIEHNLNLDDILKRYDTSIKNIQILSQFGQLDKSDNSEFWKCPDEFKTFNP